MTPWDFSDTGMSFDNPGFTFDGGSPAPPGMTMGTATNVGINPATSLTPIPVATVVDSGLSEHQRMVVETWDQTAADPIPVSSVNPMPVNVVSGGIPPSTDGSTFTAGTTAGLPALAVYNDGLANLTAGQQAAARITTDRQLMVTIGASSTEGWTPATISSVAGAVVAGQIKASGGKIGTLSLTNNGTTWAYFKAWDSAALPSLGSSVPSANYGIPPNGGNNPTLGAGLQFANGICLAITGGPAKLDTTPVGADQVQINLGFN
jgi:hypothetical protein